MFRYAAAIFFATTALCPASSCLQLGALLLLFFRKSNIQSPFGVRTTSGTS